MKKEQEKAIERLKKRIKDNEDYKTTQVWLTDDVSAVYTVLSMLKGKDKEIDLMAETIRKLAFSLASYKGSYNKETINFTGNIKDIKQYFEKKRQITVESDKIVAERKEEC